MVYSAFIVSSHHLLHSTSQLYTNSHHKSSSKTRNRSQGHHVGAQDTGSVIFATLLGIRVGRVSLAALLLLVACLILDSNVLNLGGAVAGALGALLEADVGTVVQGAARVADGDDLDAGKVTVRDLDIGGQLELVDAEQTGVGGVEELGSQGDVEVGRVLAETEVDKDISPGVVQVELQGTTLEGPIGDVLLIVVDAGALSVSVVIYTPGVEQRSRLTRVGPLAVALFVLLGESISSPSGEDETEVGRCSLDSSQGEEGLVGHHLEDAYSQLVSNKGEDDKVGQRGPARCGEKMKLRQQILSQSRCVSWLYRRDKQPPVAIVARNRALLRAR